MNEFLAVGVRHTPEPTVDRMVVAASLAPTVVPGPANQPATPSIDEPATRVVVTDSVMVALDVTGPESTRSTGDRLTPIEPDSGAAGRPSPCTLEALGENPCRPPRDERARPGIRKSSRSHDIRIDPGRVGPQPAAGSQTGIPRRHLRTLCPSSGPRRCLRLCLHLSDVRGPHSCRQQRWIEYTIPGGLSCPVYAPREARDRCRSC